MKSPAFMSLSITVQTAYMNHIFEHNQKIMDAQQQEMIQAAMMGMPPGPPEPSANAPTEPREQGKGVTKQIKNAIMGGDMPPGDMQ